MQLRRIVLVIALVGCGSPAAPPEAPPPTAPAPSVAERIAALEGASGSAADPLRTGDAAALIGIGEPALPALIDCFENDTRTTHISDLDWMQPGFLDVSTLCMRIVESILDEPGLAYREGASDRHAAAAALRAYVARYGTMEPVARRVAMLTDDTTSDQVAAIAARWLTSSGGTLDEPAAIDYVGSRLHVGPMRGVALRSDASIDLADVMLPRATRAIGAGDGHAACDIAASIVLWDPSAEPRLLPVGRSCLAAFCPCSYAFVALVAHDDPAAATRFLDQHGTTLLWSDSFSRARGVEIAAALDVPEVCANVEARLRAIDLRATLDDALREPPPTGFVVLLLAWARAGLPSARDALDRALGDARALGTISPDPGADGARVRMTSAEYTIHLPEPITAPASLRASDLVANTVALELGIAFSLGWPEAHRDEAIAAIRARLRSP